MRRLVSVMLALLAGVALPGCQGYTLCGRVVVGTFGVATIVDASNRNLVNPSIGVSGAQLIVYRDPTRPSRALVASGETGPNGAFAIPLSVFGAGWMEESWLMVVATPGFETLESFIRLPGVASDERILITLVPGVSINPTPDADAFEEVKRYR